jgi:hypothetical protein
LLDEPEGVLNNEPAQVPPPELVQVGWERTTDPGQPQRLRRSLLAGQPLDLDAHDGEAGLGRSAGMQLGPGVHPHVAIDRVLGGSRASGSTLGARISQAEPGAMQPWPTTAPIPAWGAEEHAVLSQADQAIDVQVSLG